jgi:uncharacterized protein (DUF2235 family)
MAKNIVVCCDGTANEFARDKTNVLKLFSVLRQDPEVQVTFYHPGIGTMEPAGALTTFSRRLTKLLGMAIGYGLAFDIRDAYVFLMRTYQPGDRVFLFGFSRGAYTVRAVAALLHQYGLLLPGNEPLVPYALRLLMGAQRELKKQGGPRLYFELAADWRGTLSWTQCEPHFVGVWDTVSSVGWIRNPLKLPYVTSNPAIRIGRHAVAIDERRAFFRTHLWRPNPQEASGPVDLQQVWFPGVHCDVGGGYPEKESGQSKVALQWMLAEAKRAGLLVDPHRENETLGRTSSGRHVAPTSVGELHESLRGWWRLAEFVPKKHYDWATGKTRWRMNLFRRRTIPPGALVHESAFLRGGSYGERLPVDTIVVKTPLPSTCPASDYVSGGST